jgi:hypothetical protein
MRGAKLLALLPSLPDQRRTLDAEAHFESESILTSAYLAGRTARNNEKIMMKRWAMVAQARESRFVHLTLADLCVAAVLRCHL